MKKTNRPITSREFKAMLNTDRFSKGKAGARTFRKVIEQLIRDRKGGKVITSGKVDKPRKRRTWFLDTPGGDFRKAGYVLRVRCELGKKCDLTLKFRGPDRTLSASSKLQYTGRKSKTERKFEEDVTLPERIRFSRSVKRKELGKKPKLKNLKQVGKQFPGLRKVLKKLPGKTPVKKVNGFTAHETVRYFRDFRFAPKDCKLQAGMTFWYRNRKRKGYPLVAEFSFGHETLNPKAKKKLERIPVAVARGCQGFFGKLGRQEGWVESQGTTKTAFAYEKA